MASKLYPILLLGIFSVFTIIFTGCRCEPDIYGDNILLEVPITIEVESDTLSGGDTIWIYADFNNQVLEKKSGSRIFLEDFKFFSKISFTEISDTIEYFPLIPVIEVTGSIDSLSAVTARSYPITYIESDDNYKFRAGLVVPMEVGLYEVSVSTSNLLYESYDHPAMFQCGNDRRSVVNVSYKNENSTQENFENIFLNTRVPYLLELSTLENYQSGGSVAFYVR